MLIKSNDLEQLDRFVPREDDEIKKPPNRKSWGLFLMGGRVKYLLKVEDKRFFFF